MDHLEARLLERRQPLLWVVASRLHGLDAAVDDGADVAGVVGRAHGRQEGEVHAERLVRHLAAARDFPGEVLRRALGQAGDDAEPTGLRNRGGHLGEADKMHAALDDRMLDAEQFGDARLHWFSPDAIRTEWHTVPFKASRSSPAPPRRPAWLPYMLMADLGADVIRIEDAEGRRSLAAHDGPARQGQYLLQRPTIAA